MFIETTDGCIARERVTRVTADEETGDERVEYRAADGSVCTARLESPLHAVLGSTIVPAADGYRVVRVRFADATGPALIDVAPIIGWRVPHDGGAPEPVTPYVAELDARRPDCAIESNSAPGAISNGVRYETLTLFIEARRDALQRRQAAEAGDMSRAARVAGAMPPQSPATGSEAAPFLDNGSQPVGNGSATGVADNGQRVQRVGLGNPLRPVVAVNSLEVMDDAGAMP